MRVLVTGATGFIGRWLIARLAPAGHDVVALVRRPDGAPLPGARIVAGGITDAAALGRAVDGCEAVVHLANASGVADAATVHEVNVGGTARLLEAAARAGVGRIVFTSSVSACRPRVGAYGRTKQEAEALVRGGGLPAVVLRPSLVYGSLDAGMVATLVRHLRTLPVVPVVGDGRIAIDPVYVDDVCAVLEACLARDDVVGRTYDVLGPERVGFDEFLRRLGAALGVSRPIVHLPARPALALARLLGAVLARPPLTVDHVLGLTVPARVDRAPLVRDFPRRWTPLAEGLQAMVAGARRAAA
jgi:nucleoside-diphosphate-sugar epimerase